MFRSSHANELYLIKDICICQQLFWLFLTYFFRHFPAKNKAVKKVHRQLSVNSSSPSRARTYNITVNSRALYHWAIEDYFLIQQIEEVPFFAPLLFLYTYAFAFSTFKTTHCVSFKSPTRSSLRPISICQLHTLLYFHLRPIYLVVFKGSYWLIVRDILSWGGLHA